jgi:hypothetical protein
MTDRELLEAAAKAIGLEVICHASYPNGGAYVKGMEDDWNPLTDSGDAFELAVKLNLQIHPSDDETWVSNPAAPLAEDVVCETYKGDPMIAARRAIVRAAARIGKEMK